MSPVDIIYGGLLILSVAFGHVVKGIQGAEKKRQVSTLIGVLMVIFVCGKDCFHSFVAAVVNAVVVLHLDPSICHLVSFAWGFGYIAFFRTCHFIGFSRPVPYANAIQLLLTLKMVGVAFEIHDTYKRSKMVPSEEDEKKKHALRCRYQDVKPSISDILCYNFCYIGILTGPYYKYRTYHDMLHHENVANIDTIVPLWRRLKVLPFYAAAYLSMGYFFTLDYVRQDEFFLNPFWYRLLYMVPMFFIFRMRFYCGWILSECVCMTSALGAYPAVTKPRCGSGPTHFEGFEECEKMAPEGIAYSFETVHNIGESGCEFAPTAREKMRYWNMTVQYWLSSNVYKRLTIKSGAVKVAITMTVSAFWHGIHPGYFLSFLFVPINLVAEDLMAAAFRNSASPWQQSLFDWGGFFFTMRFFEYMSMGFMLLTFKDTVAYWASIGFLGHVFLVIFITLALAFKPKRSRKDKQADHAVGAQLKKES